MIVPKTLSPRVVVTLLLTSGLGLASTTDLRAQEDTARCETPRVEPWPRTVSLIQLIANPERYDGQRVQVVGYVKLEFEGTAIYTHHTDYEYGLTKNGLWLDFDPGARTRLCMDASKNNRYAYVQGIFRASRQGHMGLFSGTLSELSRLDPSSPVIDVPRRR